MVNILRITMNTNSNNHKYYRILMEAYNDGSPFWDIVQELIEVNHWGTLTDPISDEARQARHLAIAEQAQELTQNLLVWGLVTVTRTEPPSRRDYVVTGREVEEAVAKINNWIIPLGERSVPYYSLRSNISARLLTENSLRELGLDPELPPSEANSPYVR